MFSSLITFSDELVWERNTIWRDMIRDERMVADVAVASGKSLDWAILSACCGVGGGLCMDVNTIAVLYTHSFCKKYL